MEVALRFGYKYIWVDQLCIDQSGTHKLQQIQQMNRIYQNADLTIVAAAGDNSDFGIPGVQDRSRLGRECFRIGDIHLVDAASLLRSLDRTTWGSRAWTFQEAKLSNRLLVFTERTAWFSCYLTPEEEGFEAQNPKVEPVCNREAELALARKMPRPPCGLKDPRHLRDLFCEYAGRSLTYPSDAVNAFSGILTELKEAKLIVSHVWGTPIMPMTDSASAYDRGVTHLERNAVDGFILGLMWTAYMPVDLKPRRGIPSWSWAGWQGGIDFPYLYEKGDVNFGIEAFIERTDGQVLTWSEFEGLSYLENQSHLISRFIRLKAWTIDVRLEYHEPPSGPRWHDDSTSKRTYAVTQMRNGDELLSEAVIYDDPQDGSSKDPLDELKCRVYIGVCLGKHSMSTYYTMLLRKVNGYFQRIGHVDFWDADSMKRGPSGEVTSLEPESLNFSSLCMREIRIG
ncbi:uncharacterized protein LTHEOB_10529 [Lasiodiplodia theobromae]|uniref:uncharacterized protein n=1 Tax=Lasiodiplodia theobromae TaxID=45133 RepID=UPI0015C37542|nr:uncharacterized protein LTHEOB_10529 [Lasiodiplodia theobromae]KAF4539137.1 hypothetical protein LTHEOB_10529 [Lasiodiplodia theobromae]